MRPAARSKSPRHVFSHVSRKGIVMSFCGGGRGQEFCLRDARLGEQLPAILFVDGIEAPKGGFAEYTRVIETLVAVERLDRLHLIFR